MWADLHTCADIARDSWHAQAWGDKLRVWFKHPGWRPADVAARWPKPAFEIGAVQRYDPPMSRRGQALAATLFVALLGAPTVCLWAAHTPSLPVQIASTAALIAGLCAVGWISERTAPSPGEPAGKPSSVKPAKAG